MVNLKCHKYTCSLRVVRMAEHLEVPFFPTDFFFRELHPKAIFRKILEGQSCASSHVHRITLVFPHILEGLHTLHCVPRVLSSLLDITQEDCGFHWGHTESDAVDMVDGARFKLPACPLTLLDALTYLAVSEYLTNKQSRGTTLWALPYVHFWDSPTRHSTFPPHSSN